MQCNLWFPFNGMEYPFINLARMMTDVWRAVGATEDHYALLDNNGYPTKMATGMIEPYKTFINLYLTNNDPWVLEWDGSATLSIGIVTAGVSASTNVISSNRIEYTITSGSLAFNATFLIQLNIEATTFGNNGRNIRLYRKSHETLLNAGQVWAPHFISRYTGLGRLRFMDYQNTNENQQMLWAHRSLTTDCSWLGYTLRKDTYCGLATQSSNDWTTASALTGNPSAWTQGMMVSMRLSGGGNTVKDVTSFSKASSAVIGVTAHGYSNGDLVFFIPFSLSGDFATFTAIPWFTVTVIDANSFSINLDSSAFTGTYTSGGRIAKQVRVKAGSLPFKRVIAIDGGHIGQSWATDDIRQCIYDSNRDALVTCLGPMASGVGGGGTENSKQTSVPIEHLINLANACQVNPWFCVPQMATQNWVDNFCDLLLDPTNGVSANLVSIIEFSNEVWNPGAGFTQTFWGLNQARVLWPGSVSQTAFDNIGIGNWYGYRFHQIMTAVNAKFVGRTNRIHKVISMFTAGTDLTNFVKPRLEAALASLPSTPASLANSLAIAPYIEPTRTGTADAEQVWNYSQGGALAQTALNWLDARFRDDGNTGSFTLKFCQDTLFPTWKTIANSYSLRLTQYEGGWGGIPNLNPLTASSWLGHPLTSTDRDNFFFGYAGSPQFARTVRLHWQGFLYLGGEYPSQYCVVAVWGSSGMWGCVHDDIFGTETPTYAQLTDFNSTLRPFKFIMRTSV